MPDIWVPSGEDVTVDIDDDGEILCVTNSVRMIRRPLERPQGFQVPPPLPPETRRPPK